MVTDQRRIILVTLTSGTGTAGSEQQMEDTYFDIIIVFACFGVRIKVARGFH